MNRSIESDPAAETAAPLSGRFGTFGGVFTPSALTILGVVMYMRFGWVVGNQGLLGAFIVVIVSHLISIATALSVASIATNRKVGAGGAYYMISRSLGAPAGAAIGFPLFLGQSLGMTFYIVGFTESLSALMPFLRFELVDGLSYEKVLGSFVCLALTLVSIKSAELALKVQFFVMGGIALSLVSFFLGEGTAPPADLQWGHPAHGKGFTEAFAVFFPAVTGIMAGVSMSGDLKNPRVAIPRGTLSSVLACFVIYLVFPVWLNKNATLDTLATDMHVVWEISRWPSLIYLGVWAATLSSALSSVLSAPRTLQALAQDGHAPRLFARGFGESQEPVAGLVLTFALAETGILFGNLDAIAPILTMFFLVSYGITNLACGLERWAASPSFRPDFKVPAAISLFGAGSCFYVMSIIDMPAMIGALLICGGIYALTQRRLLGTTYGDARHGIWSALVRSALHRLKEAEFHPLNWRPNLLILGGDPAKRSYLLRIGSAIVQERGIVSYAHLLKGPIAELASRRRELMRKVGSHVSEQYANVFYRVDIVEDVYRGIVTTAQAYGVGNLECNTVLMGFPTKAERQVGFLRMVGDLIALDRSVLLVNHKLPAAERRSFRLRARRPEIHIWWGGLEGNGGLMLLLAFLLTSDQALRNARVQVLTVVDGDEQQLEAEAAIAQILAAARLRASTRVIRREGREIAAIMKLESAHVELAIIGFKPPAEVSEETAASFFARMNRMLEVLPLTLLAFSARNFDSEPVLFDK